MAKAILVKSKGRGESLAEQLAGEHRPIPSGVSVLTVGRDGETEAAIVDHPLRDIACTMVAAGAIVLDLSALYGRPTLWVKLEAIAKRGREVAVPVDHSTMAEHARRVGAARARRHAIASTIIDPRYEGRGWTGARERAARAGYYHGPRTPWPARCRVQRAICLPDAPYPGMSEGALSVAGSRSLWPEYRA
jgi:hypothetical protein